MTVMRLSMVLLTSPAVSEEYSAISFASWAVVMIPMLMMDGW